MSEVRVVVAVPLALGIDLKPAFGGSRLVDVTALVEEFAGGLLDPKQAIRECLADVLAFDGWQVVAQAALSSAVVRLMREFAAEDTTVAAFAASPAAAVVEGSRLGDRALPFLLGVAVHAAVRADIGLASREVRKRRRARLAAATERRSASGAGEAQ